MTQTSCIRIAITGLNAKPDNPSSGLAVARCIRESTEFDGKIIGLSYDVMDSGLYLNETIDSAYLLPYPSSGDQALLERLQQIHNSDPFDILIPCLDAELSNVIRLQEQLEEMGIRLLLPDAEQLQRRNKDRLPELASQAGVKSPEITQISHAGFFYTCHQQGWQYPLVVKGTFYDAGVANNAEEGAALFRKISAEWGLPILVQRFVAGEELNLTALGDGKGNLSSAVMMRKRAVTDKGKAWAGVTIHDEKLLNTAKKLVNELKWAGPLEVEMLRTPYGEYHLIEINPRFPAWIYLSAAAGCNLPWTLVKMIQEDIIEHAVPDIGKLYIRYAHERVIELSEFENMTIWGQRNGAATEGK
ncbi:MAG: ATP-grasp domain-containing protein [Methylococcales bacterium]